MHQALSSRAITFPDLRLALSPTRIHYHAIPSLIMLSSFIPVPADSDFSLYNIPFGIFSPFSATESDKDDARHCGTIIGNKVISLTVLGRAGKFDQVEGYGKGWFEAVS
jgi:hypothetical protein